MRSPSTLVIMLSCAGTAMLLSAYSLGWIGGDGMTAVQHQQSTAGVAQLSDESLPDVENLRGAQLADKARFQWAMNCQGCHGPNGEGNPDRDVPTMVDVAAFQKIPEGREFLVRVPGVSRSPLNDEDLTYLLNWMIQTMGTSPQIDRKFEFSQEEVATLRKRPLVAELKQVRRSLIAKVQQ